MKGWVYIAEQRATPGRLKIGRTNWLDPEDRLRELSKDTGAADNLSLCYAAVFENPTAAEAAVHEILKEHRVKGEWFEIGLGDAIHAIRSNDHEILKELSHQNSGQEKDTHTDDPNLYPPNTSAYEAPPRIRLALNKGGAKLNFTPPNDVWFEMRKTFAEVVEKAKDGDLTAQFEIGVWLITIRSYDFGTSLLGLPIDDKILTTIPNLTSLKLVNVIWSACCKRYPRASRALREQACYEWASRAAVEEGFLYYHGAYPLDDALKWLKKAATNGLGLASSFLYKYFDYPDRSNSPCYRESLKWARLAINHKARGQILLPNLEQSADHSGFLSDDPTRILSRWERLIFNSGFSPDHLALKNLVINSRSKLYEELERSKGVVEPNSELGNSYEKLVGVKWSEATVYAQMTILDELGLEEAPIILRSLDSHVTRRSIQLGSDNADRVWDAFDFQIGGSASLREQLPDLIVSYAYKSDIEDEITTEADVDVNLPRHSVFALIARNQIETTDEYFKRREEEQVGIEKSRETKKNLFTS